MELPRDWTWGCDQKGETRRGGAGQREIVSIGSVGLT